MNKIIFAAVLFISQWAFAGQEYIVRINPGVTLEQLKAQTGAKEVVDLNFNGWVKVVVGNERAFSKNISRVSSEIGVNQKYKMQLHNPLAQKKRDDGGGFPDIGDIIGGIGGGDGSGGGGFPDIGDIIGGIGGGTPGGGSGGGAASGDPAFPTTFPAGTGADPEFSKQWGMQDIGVKEAWTNASKDSTEIIVAVIDTGVDYTHEDLASNIWRNAGETGLDANGKDKSTNGIDDDGNGFVDDVVGWDFARNDNKPYDTTGGNPFFGGNPGHGTHCAGNVGASAENGKGIVGVAPNVKIMALRFLTEQGQGDTAGAVQSIKYAADNGAKILSNSWGSEGNGGQDDTPLREAIDYAMSKGVLFIAAAGNSNYNNEQKAKQALPASYDHDNIIAVAAIDKSNNKSSFSNFGSSTVDIGAPGSAIYSTIPGNKYMNLDGTSMACPIVAGAAALYWSKNPQATWKDVKNAILGTARPIASLKGKSVTGGKLNVRDLMTK